MSMSEKEIFADEKEYQSKFLNWSSTHFLNTSHVDFANVAWFLRSTLNGLDQCKTKQPFVIGLCGNAGTGKDSATEFLLHYQNTRCVRFALADPIREIGKIFGFTRDQMTDRKLKETEDDFWKVSPRFFMQRVGTEMFRKQWREDVWIELARKKILDYSSSGSTYGFDGNPRIIFISDIRFPNEAEFVKSVGGFVVKIERDGFTKSGEQLHDSEKFVASIKQDLLIKNDAPDANIWTWKFTMELVRFLAKDTTIYYGCDDRGKFDENICEDLASYRSEFLL